MFDLSIKYFNFELVSCPAVVLADRRWRIFPRKPPLPNWFVLCLGERMSYLKHVNHHFPAVSSTPILLGCDLLPVRGNVLIYDKQVPLVTWIPRELCGCWTEDLGTLGFQCATPESIAKGNMIITGLLASMRIPSSSGQIIHKEMLGLSWFSVLENPFSIPFYREKLQTSAGAETGAW